MKSKILNRLRGAEEFVSGQQLCEEFGVSRTAVWKASISLKKKAMRSRRVHNKGIGLLGLSGYYFCRRSKKQNFIQTGRAVK